MSLIYGNNNPSKMRRRAKRAAKKRARGIKKHAKWANLNMNNPEEAASATATYDSLHSKPKSTNQ